MEEDDIPLPGISDITLRKVIKYLEHLSEGNAPPEIERPLRSNDIEDVVSDWMADFIKSNNVIKTYEWTNKVNKKKYIGAHTGSVDDGYIGGGSAFRQDLKQYGLTGFERKIIEYITDEKKIKDRSFI